MTLSYSNFFSKLEELFHQFKVLAPTEHIYDIQFSPEINWAHGPDGKAPVPGEVFGMQVTVYKEEGKKETFFI